MDVESETKLKQQIMGLSKKDSPVRSLMWKRLLTYVRLVKTTKAGVPPPPGYVDLADELESFAVAFKRITIYNYSVFGEHFEKMLDEIRNKMDKEKTTSVADTSTSSTATTTTPATSASDNESRSKDGIATTSNSA